MEDQDALPFWDFSLRTDHTESSRTTWLSLKTCSRGTRLQTFCTSNLHVMSDSRTETRRLMETTRFTMTIRYSSELKSQIVWKLQSLFQTATDNALALVQFFKRFPEYNGRDFYITGESYGGVYVPTLTKLVVQMIQNGTTPNISLKGFAVGNGALSRKHLTNSGIDLLYYRGMLGTTYVRKNSSEKITFFPVSGKTFVSAAQTPHKDHSWIATSLAWVTNNVDIHEYISKCYSLSTSTISEIQFQKTTRTMLKPLPVPRWSFSTLWTQSGSLSMRII